MGQQGSTMAGSLVSAQLHSPQGLFEVVSFSGQEEINALFNFQLRFHTEEALDGRLWIGQRAQLVLSGNDPSASFVAWPASRFISGVITAYNVLSYAGVPLVEVSLGPSLALWETSGEPRLFVHQHVLEVIDSLCKTHEVIPPLRSKTLADTATPYPYWAQLPGETDTAFIQRVLAREGLSYFWFSEQQNDEGWRLIDGLPEEETSPLSLSLVNPSGLTGLNWSQLYEVECQRSLPTYRVCYRDIDANQPSKTLTANYGQGRFVVEVWGFGARHQAHLERAARIHHEHLEQHAFTFSASCQNPHLSIGQRIMIDPCPGWLTTPALRLWKIEHHYDNHHYHTRCYALPLSTPIRPALIKKDIGALVHTARIVAKDPELPYLDRRGHYTFIPHIYDESTPITAQRLSPYGGHALNKAMGMHFPLKAPAEVVVMYLYNDAHQPLLQNALPNQQIPPMPDNSWQVRLQTAWGQYLSFQDKMGLEGIVFANSQGQNRLHLAAHASGHYIHLSSGRGSIELCAKEAIYFQTADEAHHYSQGAWYVHSQGDISIKAAHLHAQAAEQTWLAQQALHIDATQHLQLSASNLTLHSEGDVVLRARGGAQCIALSDGDLCWEADELTIEGSDTLTIQVGSSRLVFNEQGILLQGDTLDFLTPALITSVPLTPGPPFYQLPLVAPSLPELTPVRHYPFGCWQHVGTPDWEQPFYEPDGIAYVMLALRGFQGNESGVLEIVSSDNAFNQHPALGALAHQPLIDSCHFSLSDTNLNAHPNEPITPGNQRLRIPVPLTQLTKQPNQAYYVRARLGAISSRHYSNALSLLTTATLNVIEDKSEQAYAHEQAIIKLRRHLPSAIASHAHAPLTDERRYYKPPLKWQQLPLAAPHAVYLQEEGLYREWFTQENPKPALKQTLYVPKPEPATYTFTRLQPPLICDLRFAQLQQEEVIFTQQTPHARLELTPEEQVYIRANGNNLTVFIHGFDVPLGHFHSHIKRITPVESGAHLALTPDKGPATIYRDSQDLIAAHPEVVPSLIEKAAETQINQLNGTDLHQWLIHLEHQLNQAAGFKGDDYNLFSRCLFIAWPGDPGLLNYVKAEYESIRMGAIVAKLIARIHQQLPNIKLHLIAHSQGNGVLLHALNALKAPLVEHAFFWQAAIPSDALSTHPKPGAHQWACPHAANSAKRITVLYSKNDNILGPLLHQVEQPPEVLIKNVWQHKPWEELITSLSMRAFALESLYQVAAWLDVPLPQLWHTDGLEKAWQNWRHKHATLYVHSRHLTLPCQPTLCEQRQLLEQHKLMNLLNEDFTLRVIQGCSEVFQLIQERFDPNGTYQRLLHHAFNITNFIIQPWPQAKLPQLLMRILKGLMRHLHQQNRLPQLNEYQAIAHDPHVQQLVNTYLHKEQTLWYHARTFVQSTIILNGVKEKQALGYEGPDTKDLSIKAMVDSGKIIDANTTPFLWHHSDMKLPNERVMENVYKEFIINQDNKEKGMRAFGKYPL